MNPTPTPPAMKDNPAMRAAESLARKDYLKGVHPDAVDMPDELKARILELTARFIEAEYATERRECVRVMEAIALDLRNYRTGRIDSLASTERQLRELIRKLGE